MLDLKPGEEKTITDCIVSSPTYTYVLNLDETGPLVLERKRTRSSESFKNKKPINYISNFLF